MPSPEDSIPLRRDVTAVLRSPPDADELRAAVQALAPHVEAAYAAYADTQVTLAGHLEEVMHLLAGVLQRLAHPEITTGLYEDQIDAIDRRLIELLAEGKKRHGLHAEVGIGPYEVTSRLKRMYELTGSATQFQFARACVSRLWLPADPGGPRGRTS